MSNEIDEILEKCPLCRVCRYGETFKTEETKTFCEKGMFPCHDANCQFYSSKFHSPITGC